jgi:NADH:ubiquinone oxidoreductase subunit 4 (subunit M)
MQTRKESLPTTRHGPPTVVSALMIILIWLGVYPGPLIELIRKTAQRLM